MGPDPKREGITSTVTYGFGSAQPPGFDLLVAELRQLSATGLQIR
ncbi:hypothetical protein ADICYQ_5945 [Cyclobacterium qasimii M12-11B]|uniref:Uncharacterized protein n=1 Tax=Cyclobacterium qasimii M12-11B TaxID=641524 RepID=S7V527_9BACT|nr:hypothetical protein ADICYQ_5945 [Cyclobacterium qasimii M12-11B]